MRLRDYQRETIDKILGSWLENQSCLVVMPTGCGKTVTFAHMIRELQPKRTLVIAHREELITQAQQKISSIAEVTTDIEMGSLRSDFQNAVIKPQVVVSSIQTQTAGGDGSGRMGKFDPSFFDVLVIDEAHHAVSKSYKRLTDYYAQNPNLKIVGFTATPDRADEAALGQVFQDVACDYEIINAIDDGWLVPVMQQMVSIGTLDFSSVRTTAGDLNGADLAEVMELEKNLQGVCSATLDIIGNRRAMVFAASVVQAERMSEIFNRHLPGLCDWASGDTDKQLRRDKLAAFRSGKLQILCNCNLWTEGFDDPGIEIIVMARPTKSRSLYAQMAGRGFRPADAIAHDLNDISTAIGRREMIERSAKPSMLIIDFVGNAGRHKLMTSADILGGDIDDEAVEAATARAAKEGRAVDMRKLIEDEEKELIKRKQQEEERKLADAAKRLKLKASVTYSLREINPFATLGIVQPKERGWDTTRRLSDKQRDILMKQGVDPDKLGYRAARQLIGTIFERWDKKLCSIKQANTLRKFGVTQTDVSMDQAKTMIDAIAQTGWKYLPTAKPTLPPIPPRPKKYDEVPF